MDESKPPSTTWNYSTVGPQGHGEKLIFEGINPDVYPYNINVTFICDTDTEISSAAEYKPNERKFYITVRTSASCRSKIGEITMVFYHYRFFIMTICAVLGIYVNYYGIRKVKYTLMLFGFVFCFFFSMFLFTALLHTRKLTSLQHLQHIFRDCALAGRGSVRRVRLQAPQALHQLRFWWGNQSQRQSSRRYFS